MSNPPPFPPGYFSTINGPFLPCMMHPHTMRYRWLLEGWNQTVFKVLLISMMCDKNMAMIIAEINEGLIGPDALGLLLLFIAVMEVGPAHLCTLMELYKCNVILFRMLHAVLPLSPNWCTASATSWPLRTAPMKRFFVAEECWWWVVFGEGMKT